MKRILSISIAAAVTLAMAVASCDTKNNTKGVEPSEPVVENPVTTDLLTMLSDSIANDASRPDLFLARAQEYLRREQVGAAMMDVNQAIQLNPSNVDAFLLLADLYYVLGDEPNITATLNKAIEIDPYDARPMVKLAELNLLQQNYNVSIGYIENALKINTYNPKAYFVKGMLYLAKQDTTSAMKNFMIAREQDGGFYDPLREICLIYQNQHNPLAESFMRNAVQQFPEETMARYDLALFLQDNGYPEEALAHYDTLLLEQPGNSRLLFNKGYVNFVYLEDNETALSYFNQALDSDPNYLDALYNKGHVLEQMGDYVQAKNIYSEVLKRKTNYQLAIDALNRIANLAE